MKCSCRLCATVYHPTVPEGVALDVHMHMISEGAGLTLHVCVDASHLVQFIVELEGGNDSSVDLTGDAGVVGRWLVEGDNNAPELKMDMKGVMYAATTVSLNKTDDKKPACKGHTAARISLSNTLLYAPLTSTIQFRKRVTAVKAPFTSPQIETPKLYKNPE